MNDVNFNFDNSYSYLPDIFYTHLSPDKSSDPKIALMNDDLAVDLNLNINGVSQEYLAGIFSGNIIPPNTSPLSMAYCGHQFGHFTTLGDGRAHLIGEHITPDHQRFDVQLKGSGRTPYSRNGDGRAALKPMLREYIISESMHALGIPTTRSLAVVITGDRVQRETGLTGAILTRIAASHIRIGTFEFAAVQQDISALKTLLDYTIERHYPDLKQADNKAIALLKKIIEKQTDLITHWMRVGFIHGVMNTDNMTLSGETIDYGPCAFMDSYDPKTVFSSIDHMGRYAYGNQPYIAKWNIARFAESLLPLIHSDIQQSAHISEEIVQEFDQKYHEKWLRMMRRKLGMLDALPEDEKIIHYLLAWMQNNHADYTNCFRVLSEGEFPKDKIYQCRKFKDWHQRWKSRVDKNKDPLEDALALMKKNNPVIIPRNHHVEHILEAADKGNLSPMHQALQVFKEPYEAREAHDAYKDPPQSGERIFQTFCGT